MYDKKLVDLFNDLDGKEMEKARRSALRKAGNILKKETKKNLSQSVRNSYVKNPKYGKSLQSGVINKTTKENGVLTSIVHIMGDFRLKFFEKGTKERYIGKKEAKANNKKWDAEKIKKDPIKSKTYKRGRIKPTHFFAKARTAKEKEVFDSMNKILRQTINKIK